MNKLGKKTLSLALTMLLTVGLLPTAASAAVGIQENVPPAFALNSDTVSFAGHEWYVVGDGSSGVCPQSGHITLLAKESTFGGSAFRDGESSDSGIGYTYYPGDGQWYEGNFSDPSDYNDSTLMNFMEDAANALPSKEAALITPRALDGVAGAPVTGQTLWPLSTAEYTAMGPISGDPFVGHMGGLFWLRSPSGNTIPSTGASGGSGSYPHILTDPSMNIRPALQLNLSSVLFTSDASGANAKSAATAGGGLVAAQALTDTKKFTMLDSGLSLNCMDTATRTVRIGDTVSIAYNGATTGTNNYVSCVIVDSGNQITHYGKLSQAANGAAGFTVPGGMAPGAYTIRLFSEECSGDNYTDFASTPIHISMTVVGTVADASLTVTAPTIASETVGYTQPAAQALTIANSGGVDAVITSVALSGANANEFEIGGSGGTIPGGGSMNTWTVRPKAGLAAAAHTAQIDVTYANGGTNTTAGDTVRFTVNPTSSSGSGGATTYTMTYHANGGKGSDHKVSGISSNAKHTVLTASAAGISREGYDFKGWNTKTDGSGTAYAAGSSLTVKQSVTLYAQWEKTVDKGALETGNHITYIKGYTDGTVRPDNAITRAEASAIFYRLLKNPNTVSGGSFSDVKGGAWYSDAVNCLESMGIVTGYPDGSFQPDAQITRAEFATIASRFDALDSGASLSFTDVSANHWAYDYIASAYAKGWVSGYSDSIFRPDNSITRAEVVKVVNAMLGRKIDSGALAQVTNPYQDLSKNHWAYADIIEASVIHEYTKNDNGVEIWKTW